MEIVEMKKTASGRRYPKELRRVSECGALLARNFSAKLNAIEIASAVPAAKISSEIARLHPSTSPPRGDREWVGPREWEERWQYCRCNAERLEVLIAMEEQLGVQTVDQKKVRGSREWKLAIAKDERASAVVAAEVGISPSRVRQLRMDLVAGRLYRRRTG